MKRKDYALLDWGYGGWYNLTGKLTRGRGRANHDGAMVAVAFGYRGDESPVEKKRKVRDSLGIDKQPGNPEEWQ